MAGRASNRDVCEGSLLHRPLSEQGPLLGEPYTKQLDGKLRELRFYLDGDAVRVTYWIGPGRRIILLTRFRKTRWREDREITRARRAMARCVAEGHTVDEETDDEGANQLASAPQAADVRARRYGGVRGDEASL